MDYEGIKKWLANDRSYQEGVALYAMHGKSQALKDLFAKGELGFTRKRLRTALEELVQHSPAAKPVSASFPENSPKTSEPPKRAAHPEVNGRLRPLLDERTMLHAQLERMPEEECAVACLRIVELTKQISAIYFNQEQPAAAPPDFSHITDRAKLQQELTNMRSLRAKLKKNPKRHEELPALQAKIDTVSQLLTTTPNDH